MDTYKSKNNRLEMTSMNFKCSLATGSTAAIPPGLQKAGSSFGYSLDFGINWQITVVFPAKD